jgi:hypothetical protein
MLLHGMAPAAIFTFLGGDGVPRTGVLIQPILLLLMVDAKRSSLISNVFLAICICISTI